MRLSFVGEAVCRRPRYWQASVGAGLQILFAKRRRRLRVGGRVDAESQRGRGRPASQPVWR
jgi:hypothetical protein